MEITDKITFERGREVKYVNIDELIKKLETNGIKIDPAISEKVVNYSLEREHYPSDRTCDLISRESFVPMRIDTQDLNVVGYILRSYNEKGRLEIELQNSRRGDINRTVNVPSFQIKVEGDAEHGMDIMNNVRKSLNALSYVDWL